MCMPAPTLQTCCEQCKMGVSVAGGKCGFEGSDGDGVLGSRDASIEDKAKLSMMCWNVCGWCKEGGGIEQMREEHDIRADVIDLYRPDVVALVQAWL